MTIPTATHPTARVHISWADRDGARDLSIITLVGIALAAVMAVFGLPPLNIHGPQHFIVIMDPLCGMTRAVRFLALGDIARAVHYNPASPLLALFAAVMLVRLAAGLSTHRWLDVRVHRSLGLRVALGMLIAMLWINQQAHAALLMRT